MTGINYIKSTLKKMDNDNLLNFLLDVVTCGGIDTVEDYNNTKQYRKDEKVYYKDMDGMHHIYICMVDEPAIGEIYDDEWVDLLQSFRRPTVNPADVISNVEMIEEAIIATTPSQNTFTITTPGIENNLYTVIVYHPTKGRLAKTDWRREGRRIILKPDFVVPSVGQRLVVDLVKKN